MASRFLSSRLLNLLFLLMVAAEEKWVWNGDPSTRTFNKKKPRPPYYQGGHYQQPYQEPYYRPPYSGSGGNPVQVNLNQFYSSQNRPPPVVVLDKGPEYYRPPTTIVRPTHYENHHHDLHVHQPSFGSYEKYPRPSPGVLVGPGYGKPYPSSRPHNPIYNAFDRCKCVPEWDCKRPGVPQGSCDFDKQYCCYNTRPGPEYGRPYGGPLAFPPRQSGYGRPIGGGFGPSPLEDPDFVGPYARTAVRSVAINKTTS